MNTLGWGSIPSCLVLVLLLGLLVASGCSNTRSTERQSSFQKPIVTLRGAGLSTRSNQAEDFTDFFVKANQMGEVVMWAGDWIELNRSAGGGPTVVAELASRYGYLPLIEAQFFTQSTGRLLRPLDDATKRLYEDSAAAFAQNYDLEYLGLGIEINTLYERSLADFEAFTRFFSEVYDVVKESSPDTKVFTVFQLEKMKGLNGGLFGGSNNSNQAQWALLDKFPKSDIIAFTTYPGLVYKNPSEIPDDYYADISQHTTKPIAFTEMGWHSEASPSGWESSEIEQAEFVSKFFILTRNLHKEFVIWSFVYDQDTIEPFRSMGLYNKDATAKLAWNEWLKADESSALRQ